MIGKIQYNKTTNFDSSQKILRFQNQIKSFWPMIFQVPFAIPNRAMFETSYELHILSFENIH